MKKTTREINILMAARREWANERKFCWVCGASHHAGFPLETHEMERKSQAPYHAWANLNNYFCACKKCHMDDLAAMPHARQLAYKIIYDTHNFEIEGWLKLKDPELKAPRRVELKEILTHFKELKEKGHPKWR
jgi:hypothetical protein